MSPLSKKRNAERMRLKRATQVQPKVENRVQPSVRPVVQPNIVVIEKKIKEPVEKPEIDADGNVVPKYW